MNRPSSESARPPAPAGRVLFGPRLEGVVILLVAAFFAFSYFSGSVRRFVAPSYVWLAGAGAALLAAMALVRLLGRAGACEACGAIGSWRPPTWACAIALTAPIGLVLAVRPHRYSPEGLRKRQAPAPAVDARFAAAMDWVLGERPADTDADAEKILSARSAIPDILRLAAAGRRDALAGRFVTLTGQCDPHDGPAGRRFALFRLVVTCCIADATAVMLDVVRTDTTPLEPGGWVRVEGILRFDNPVDATLPILHATSVVKIAEPSQPYL